MRIASLSPATTEILFAIGAGDQIVCVDRYSDEPEGVHVLPHLPEHQAIRYADIARHTPDVVFTMTLVQEKLSTSLRAQGLSVVHLDPRTIAEVESAIQAIGLIVEKEKQAEALVHRMRTEFAAVQKTAKFLPRKPRVYIEEWHHPPMVSGNWVPEIVRIASGEPLFLPARAPSRGVELSEIQKFDPDLIVLSICGAGKFAEPSLLRSRPGWSELRAVKNNHLFVLHDSLLNRPGPRLTEAARQLYGLMFQVLH